MLWQFLLYSKVNQLHVCPLFLFIYSFFIFIFWPHRTAHRILVPRPGIEPVPPALEAQSLNQWTAREVPIHSCLGSFPICHCRVLNRVPCTIQQVLISCLFYIQQCVYANPNLPIYPSPPRVVDTLNSCKTEEKSRMVGSGLSEVSSMIKVTQAAEASWKVESGDERSVINQIYPPFCSVSKRRSSKLIRQSSCTHA